MNIELTDVIYVAGPMTGIPLFNIPAFDTAAEKLRGDGYKVVSPAELDDPATRRAALRSSDGIHDPLNGETWGDFLARDVKLIADNVDVIAVLPGWEKSRGARLETFIGRKLCGLKVVYYPTLRKVPKLALAKAWLGGWFKELLVR